jgi:hypothetical protein
VEELFEGKHRHRDMMATAGIQELGEGRREGKIKYIIY